MVFTNNNKAIQQADQDVRAFIINPENWKSTKNGNIEKTIIFKDTKPQTGIFKIIQCKTGQAIHQRALFREQIKTILSNNKLDGAVKVYAEGTYAEGSYAETNHEGCHIEGCYAGDDKESSEKKIVYPLKISTSEKTLKILTSLCLC